MVKCDSSAEYIRFVKLLEDVFPHLLSKLAKVMLFLTFGSAYFYAKK